MTTPMNCECNVCLGVDDDFDKTTFEVDRALEAKPDEYVIMWQAGTYCTMTSCFGRRGGHFIRSNYCTITSCKAFALKSQANEDYISLWQNWLKTQIDEDVSVRNMIRHPFCPTENIPTVEWLKNVDNFHLLRSYLLLDQDDLELDKHVSEESIMKYIYGLFHFATIRVCFDDHLEGLPYSLNREMKLLDIYYDWEIDERLKARIPIGDYDLRDIEHRQWKQKIQEINSGTYKPKLELPQLITLKIN
jgi:hypothetical protein